MLTRRGFLSFGVALVAAAMAPTLAVRRVEAKGLNVPGASPRDTDGDGSLQAVGYRVRRRRHRGFGFNGFRRRGLGKPGFRRRRIFRRHFLRPQPFYGRVRPGYVPRLNRARRSRRYYY